MYSLDDLQKWQKETKAYVIRKNGDHKLKSPAEVLIVECERFVVNKTASIDVIVSNRHIE